MRPTPDQLLTEVGAVDSGTNWLPQPVAETLIGYARPVAGTTIPPAQPSPPPAPSAPGPPVPVPSAPEPTAAEPSAPAPPATGLSAPEPPLGAPRAPAPATPADVPVSDAPGPGGPANRPGPGSSANAEAPAVTPGGVPSAGPRAPVPRPLFPGAPVSPPSPRSEDFFEGLYRQGPAPKRPDVGRVPSTTTPLGWRSDLARPPRRRRRMGRVLAAGSTGPVAGRGGRRRTRAHHRAASGEPANVPRLLLPRCREAASRGQGVLRRHQRSRVAEGMEPGRQELQPDVWPDGRRRSLDGP